jgi:hypothetical protein
MEIKDMPPVMKELFRLIPPTGCVWPIRDRIIWMETFKALSDLLWKDDEPIKMTIRSVPKDVA